MTPFIFPPKGVDPRRPGKRGKLGAVAPTTVKNIGSYLISDLPPVNGFFDYGQDVIGGFPMADNDRLGCCTVSGFFHLGQLAYALVKQPLTYPGDDATQAAYFALTGGQDTGCVESAVLNAAEAAPLLGVKATMWASIDPTDQKLMQECLQAFGALYLGAEMPSNAEAQFQNNLPWTLTPGINPGQDGHCFIASGVCPIGFNLITWGAETSCSWNWWKTYGSECYVVIPDVFVTVGHGALANINTAQLEADCIKENGG